MEKLHARMVFVCVLILIWHVGSVFERLAVSVGGDKAGLWPFVAWFFYMLPLPVFLW